MSPLVEKALSILGLDEVVTRALSVLVMFHPSVQDVKELLVLANLSEEDLTKVIELATALSQASIRSIEDVFAIATEFFNEGGAA